MEHERIKNYLDQILSRQASPQSVELLPLIDRWKKILSSIPSLVKRSPWRHCRICDWQNAVVTVETDHPAWMQLLLWEEENLLDAIKSQVPELTVVAIHFRTNKGARPLTELENVELQAEKPALTQEEELAKKELVKMLEEMIRKPPK